MCLAYRCEGSKRSRCAVVLCQREKLQMEAEFRRVIPEGRRCGTRFVFRQGLPLIPDDLRQVAASQAAATIVISDSSRSAFTHNSRLERKSCPRLSAFDHDKIIRASVLSTLNTLCNSWHAGNDTLYSWHISNVCIESRIPINSTANLRCNTLVSSGLLD